MKNLSIFVAALSLLAFSTVSADVKREHRAVWCSPGLAEWPTTGLTSESTAQRQVKNLTAQLDKFQAHNINTVYFHVRSHCDANYKSSYEPWSDHTAGARGTTAPVIDPLQTMVEECHKRGIECYAWVNPYRYSGKALYGGGDYNYEVTHPEWLLTKDNYETILNPALPEVQQRIVDVCKEIITEYDVDGLIFDDYFYTTNTPMEKDVDLYNAYKAAGGTAADQAAWRRENVNTMVRKVGEMVAATRPEITFAISPAGKCNPPTVTSEYGLPDSGMADWQYACISSDPLYWLKHHLIDMVSPQLYRTMEGGFADDSTWWVMAANKFGRNISPSADMTVTTASEQLIQQQLWVRDLMMPDYAGLTIFSWKPYVNFREKDPVTGTNQPMTYFLNQGVYQNVALQVLHPWRNSYKPEMVSDIALADGSLTWTAASAGRYTVYAIPSSLADSEFKSQPEYLLGVTYTNSYTIPEDKLSGYRFAVAVYDRYGNEYSPLIMGATPTVTKAPQLLLPADGGRPAPLGDFTWENTASRYIVEFAEANADMAMNEIVASFEVYEPRLSSGVLAVLDSSKSYLWRVTASSVNATEAQSVVRRFDAAKMEITSPADGALTLPETPTFTFTQAAEGAQYLLELSSAEKFNPIFYSVTVDQPQITLPEGVVSTGSTIYARVTAIKGDHSFQSPQIKVRTADVNYTEPPVFTSPEADAMTLYSNHCISVAPWHGLNGVVVEISEKETFPARGATLQTTLTQFATDTKPLGEMRISNQLLVDGQTYYLRARGRFMTGGTKTNYTEYSPVWTFTYNSGVGVQTVGSDADNSHVEYFDIQGLPVANPQPGQILIRRQGTSTTKIIR